MKKIPSKIRKEGWEAFAPHVWVGSVCPYEEDTVEYQHFINGWCEAKKEYDEKERDFFNKIGSNCPWRDSDECIASYDYCEESNCAVVHIFNHLK
jgi:hypothetical protein